MNNSLWNLFLNIMLVEFTMQLCITKVHSLCWTLLHCLACLNVFLLLEIKWALTREDNEAWNCPSQGNPRHRIRSPQGCLPSPSLMRLGHAFPIWWTSEKHQGLLSGSRTPYGDCLRSWHQAKRWHFFSSFHISLPLKAHIWKPYTTVFHSPSALHTAVLSCRTAIFLTVLEP